MLASRFAKTARFLRSDRPLSDDQIRGVAPSIFAEGAHESRSARYTYIPTSDVLGALRKEGFEPFFVTQAQARDEGKRAHTKHMLRLRHAGDVKGKSEANEIILLNSHDGTSTYQMLAGMFRFVCSNGLVCGETVGEVRVPHKGNVTQQVVAGAYDILDGFARVVEEREGMQAVALGQGEQIAFARAALALRYEPEAGAPPVTEDQLLTPRRFDDVGDDLWRVFNRVQEHTLQGGLRGRAASGRRMTTRPVNGIGQNVHLNRALWVLAEEMRRLRAA